MMKRSLFAVLAFALVIPGISLAATASSTSFEVSAWIPYWKSVDGVGSILPELQSFTEVDPFMYTVKSDGTLNEASGLTDSEWTSLYDQAHALNIRFVPTIMWSGGVGSDMERILNDPTLRAAHVKAIAAAVYAHKLDGIDIDYEGLSVSGSAGFTAFLQELNAAIGYDKWIMCTVPARTPIADLDPGTTTPDSDVEHAYDYAALNTYCDRVRIMTYDQNRGDVALDNTMAAPYAPVADVTWVKRVMQLAMQSIDPSKLMIGVATYGYEYDMFNTSNGAYDPNSTSPMQYSLLWSFNPGYAATTASTLGITPVRDSAGEMMLTYPASKSLDPSIPLPNAERVMSWSDATAIQQKIDLAQSLGLRGVSIFKIDGGQDPNLFSMLSQYTISQVSSKPEVTAARDALSSGLSTGATAPASAASSLVMPTSDLETGSVSAGVKTLQEYLNDSGYTLAASGPGSPGNETTMFGALTRTALAKFQKDNNVSPASGYYGPLTRAKIKSL